MALGSGEVHIAAQGPVKVLQGFLRHLHLPLGDQDVLGRETAGQLRRGRPRGRTLPFLAWAHPTDSRWDYVPAANEPPHQHL